MSSLTTDPNDPRLTRGTDKTPRPQADAYLVLSEEERAKGFLQPVRKTYLHTVCRTTTTMDDTIAETYARDPWFYGGTYCVQCAQHRPLEEFVWNDGSAMAPHRWTDSVQTQVQARIAELDAQQAPKGP